LSSWYPRVLNPTRRAPPARRTTIEISARVCVSQLQLFLSDACMGVWADVLFWVSLRWWLSVV
jgi:hypothetical protein